MKFTPDSETTRQAIIESTADLFNKKGFAGTFISDITAATGLTKGGIYGNFKNKDDVASATLDFNIKRRAAIIDRKINTASSYREKLIAYADLFSSRENKVFAPGGCPLMNTACEADDTNPELMEPVSVEMARWKNGLVAIINDGIQAAEFKKDTNAVKIALTIIAIIEGSVLLGRALKSNEDRDLVLESVKDLIDNMATGSV
ncbi:TetR/AcrR family transcriptional regulator [Mucilaginibacter sp. CAU 1740]|uniref:TetR/AcrR family transcriptional regulator n=1 Tax=Mucilaginibacter sp. CAU 1740 TaxID=3140365 RepID=UPI00325B1432